MDRRWSTVLPLLRKAIGKGGACVSRFSGSLQFILTRNCHVRYVHWPDADSDSRWKRPNIDRRTMLTTHSTEPAVHRHQRSPLSIPRAIIDADQLSALSPSI
jgi:hypothetical protein